MIVIRALVAAVVLAGAAPVRADEPPQGIHAFVAAYPEHLLRVEGGYLWWRDGTRMPLAALGLGRDGRPVRPQGKPAADPLVAATEAISAVDYEPIYLKIYGNCRAGDMADRLATVRWNRASPDGPVELKAARANGVAAALQRVSDALDREAGGEAAFHRATGGTFNCRAIAGTDRLSLHGFGIAIDVAPTEEGYWQTADTDRKGRPIRRNHMPAEVVAAFEREGFVWGGRWNRFDTFHFEYRPEYRIATGGPLPARLTRESFTGFFGGRVRRPVVERMSYAPRPKGAAVCHRWVRQPGPNFGRCLSAPVRRDRR
ncbi:M15 family metallopeptidase [Stella sp.]|uniref:M15 family metallopeptidase n=1 Tax=Stella sp. TaxID=2912054 RepID=UPI0035B37CA0